MEDPSKINRYKLFFDQVKEEAQQVARWFKARDSGGQHVASTPLMSMSGAIQLERKAKSFESGELANKVWVLRLEGEGVTMGFYTESAAHQAARELDIGEYFLEEIHMEE